MSRDSTESEQSAIPEAEQGSPSSVAAASKTDTASTATATKPHRQQSPTTAVVRTSWGLRLLLLLLCILSGALAAAGYWGWQHYQQVSREQSQSLQQSLQQMQEQVVAITRQTEQIQQRTQSVDAQLPAKVQELFVQQQRNAQLLQVTQQRLQTLAGTERSDWKLAEAEFLLRLAHQRLQVEEQPSSALALLNAADDIIQDVDMPALLDVRKVLAKDREMLRLLPDIDRQGLYLQLSALAEQVDHLVVNQRQPQDYQKQQQTAAVETATSVLIDTPSTTESAGVESQSWWQKLQQSAANTLAGLGDYIKIRRHTEPVVPLMSDADASLLRHNVRVVFEQAQLSMLRGEADIYRASLAKVEHWIGTYFIGSQAAQRFLQRVQQLQQQPVARELPDISSSLQALQRYQRQQRPAMAVESVDEA